MSVNEVEFVIITNDFDQCRRADLIGIIIRTSNQSTIMLRITKATVMPLSLMPSIYELDAQHHSQTPFPLGILESARMLNVEGNSSKFHPEFADIFQHLDVIDIHPSVITNMPRLQISLLA